jgi:translation initiation factor 2B subunit (eIF-2B alpha/beta/delta family)
MTIDALKLAKRLEQANLSRAQAEAIAQTLQEAAVAKQELAVTVAELRNGLNKLRTEIRNWIVSSVSLGAIINHFWR